MSFSREHTVKVTRKPHRCDVCRKMIEIGSSAIRYAGNNDGDFVASIMHVECRAAEIALNREFSGPYDEWMTLEDAISDGDGYWLREKHPIVAARMLADTDARPRTDTATSTGEGP